MPILFAVHDSPMNAIEKIQFKHDIIQYLLKQSLSCN